MMKHGMGWITGAGAGAAAAYLLDPETGGRRRALIRDKAIHTARVLGRTANSTARDIAHRARGLVASSAHLVRAEDVPDAVLVERVRAALGRVTSHPHAINVTAQEGHVVLSGPILAGEVSRVVERVSGVRGVQGLENLLDVHASADHVPALQGGIPLPETRSRRNAWLTGAAAAAAAVLLARRRRAISARTAAAARPPEALEL